MHNATLPYAGNPGDPALCACCTYSSEAQNTDVPVPVIVIHRVQHDRFSYAVASEDASFLGGIKHVCIDAIFFYVGDQVCDEETTYCRGELAQSQHIWFSRNAVHYIRVQVHHDTERTLIPTLVRIN